MVQRAEIPSLSALFTMRSTRRAARRDGRTSKDSEGLTMHQIVRPTGTRLRGRYVLLVIGVAAVVAACGISAAEEQELGQEEAAQVDSEVPMVRDTAVDRFVSALGLKLAAAAGRADESWRFAVVNTEQLNAFSLPGGYVYVNRGLIEQSDRLDELAGVMGHEIGHIVRRHSVKQLEKGKKRDVGLVALCTLTNACRSVGGVIAVQAGADAMTARHSQRDELEADAEGVQYAVQAGYDPEGLAAFLQKMLEQRKSQPSLVEAIFASHPPDQARIVAINRRIEALGDLRARHLVRDTPELHAMQARLRALPPPPPPKKTAK